MKKSFITFATLALFSPTMAFAADTVAEPTAATLPESAAIAAEAVQSASPMKGHNQRVEWQQKEKWELKAKPIDFVHSLDGKLIFVLSDEQTIDIYEQGGKLQGRIPVDAGVRHIDISPRGEALFLLDSENKTFTGMLIDLVATINTKGSPFLGNEDAPVTLAIFTDFECPYCSQAAPLVEEIFEKNSETVRVVFKNLPLSFHQNARPAALAALAANEQGKFWQMHDALFAAPKLDAEKIEAIAKEQGLDMDKFNADRIGPKVEEALMRDMRDAQEIGVNSTPTIYINGRKARDRNPADIQAMIDEELAAIKK